jgi:sugar-specific transcriptional regulator TrmB
MDSRVYLFLAKRGLQQARDIAKSLKMNKQQLYRSLTNLQSKGIVGATLEHPARFSAVPFEKVLDLYVRAKTEEAQTIQRSKEEILSVWRSIAAGDTDAAARFMVIEGRSVIYSRIQQMIKETKNQLLTISTVSGLVRADQFGLFNVDSEFSPKPKAKFRFLTDLSEQNVDAMKTLLREMANAKISFEGRTPNLGLNVFPRMVIRDEEEALFFITSAEEGPTLERDTVCLWTNSKALVHAFTAMFEDLWHNSTDIQKKIDEIETGKPTPKTYIINDEQTAQKKYNEVMNLAEKEILVMTSSKGLLRLSRDMAFLKEQVKKGISIRIMAPIVNENHDVAKQLLEYSAVRHVPTSYLGTTIIDGKYLFQFKTPLQEQEKLDAAQCFENTFYSNDLEYVEKTRTMLEDIWKNASIPPATKLETVLSFPAPTLPRPQYTDSTKISGRKLTVMHSLLAVEAIIQPLGQLKMPNLLIEVFLVGKTSTFGAGVTMIVHLGDENLPCYSPTPVAIVDTNPHPNLALVEKTVFAGTPAAQNIMIVKPDELELYKRGNTLFAGWTVSIPLPPTPNSLPPSCIVLEGHGNSKHRSLAYDLPSGYKIAAEWDVRDAFLTFMSPSLNYAGPATEGMVGKHVATIYAP